MQKQNSAMWNSIDYLAHVLKTSCAALAQNGGLNPTTFNKSKRISKYGQMRWLSMETILKVLKSSHITFLEYAVIFQMMLDSDNTIATDTDN